MKSSIHTLLSKSILAVFLCGMMSYAAATKIEVYKSPTCKCCEKWVDHMRANGFTVETKNVGNKEARERAGISPSLGSCHTSLVEGYVIEGHVPASDIRRFLSDRPSAIGLAAPGMPNGSPGMENSRSNPYNVLLINKEGNVSVYSRHLPSDKNESLMRLK
ncbi:MAG: DUF411 domain-containing protein [Nitrosomonadales bacterium]|jgi:hypothetical protein|nr:MAG: DUF411 domain-containing protein [Nitrosomonadales bacterium]